MFCRPSAISRRIRRRAAAAAACGLAALAPAMGAARVEVLRSVSGLPPEIVGKFEEPLAFQQAAGGQYFIFDRRAHTVYGIDERRTAAWKLLQVGHETGRVIEPRAFDLAPNGTFAIADAPRGLERIQIFGPGGNVIGGFTLPGRATARVAIGNLVLSGVGAMQYTGASFLVSHPESGTLVTEYSPNGGALRGIGQLRATGFEHDRDLHLALNAGLPLVDPTGGFVYVFMAGRPLFRKYDAKGELVFERHIEGRELDAHLRTLPTRWPRRKVEELPFVAPTVRAAAVDARGQLWVSLVLPYTYVYDADGEKARTVQFRAAGIIAPTSLFFTAGGRLLVTPGCYEFQP